MTFLWLTEARTISSVCVSLFATAIANGLPSWAGITPDVSGVLNVGVSLSARVLSLMIKVTLAQIGLKVI